MRSPLKLTPWLIALQALVVLREHWVQLDQADRDDVVAIVRRTNGLLHKATAAERSRLVEVAKNLRPFAVARKTAFGSRKLLP